MTTTPIFARAGSTPAAKAAPSFSPLPPAVGGRRRGSLLVNEWPTGPTASPRFHAGTAAGGPKRTSSKRLFTPKVFGEKQRDFSGISARPHARAPVEGLEWTS
jgi:hypothetical protein